MLVGLVAVEEGVRSYFRLRCEHKHDRRSLKLEIKYLRIDARGVGKPDGRKPRPR
jgi:hypothetical protein